MPRVNNPIPLKMDIKIRSIGSPVHLYYWAPGNMTGYELSVARMSEHEILIAWLWRGAAVGGAAMVFDFRESYDIEYVAGKMDIKDADAIAVCQFARYLFPQFSFTAPRSAS